MTTRFLVQFVFLFKSREKLLFMRAKHHLQRNPYLERPSWHINLLSVPFLHISIAMIVINMDVHLGIFPQFHVASFYFQCVYILLLSVANRLLIANC